MLNTMIVANAPIAARPMSEPCADKRCATDPALTLVYAPRFKELKNKEPAKPSMSRPVININNSSTIKRVLSIR